MNIQSRSGPALEANLNWFIKSGVFGKANGNWGVAERLVLKNNTELDRIYRTFPAWTEHADHSIIEQRRPDCNFQTALLFLLAAKALHRKEYEVIAENILDFLYFRSGLLNRFPAEEDLAATWAWSHVLKTIWFDDNSWCVYVPLVLGEMYPELESRYDMRSWALALARRIASAFDENFEKNQQVSGTWQGNLSLPHWGSLVCMALGKAFEYEPSEQYGSIIQRYHNYVQDQLPMWNTSELAYALIGSTCCTESLQSESLRQLAQQIGSRLEQRMDPKTGNLSSEHYETPAGSHLVDTIYTVNWALMGLQNLQSITQQTETRRVFEQLLAVLMEIQDLSPEIHVNGCWRGLYDLESKNWGGGDLYEGGANSIYSGWTNAPIAICLALEKMGTSFATLGRRKHNLTTVVTNPALHSEYAGAL